MDPDFALIVIGIIAVTGIVARTVVKITSARLAAGTGHSDELKTRVDKLERVGAELARVQIAVVRCPRFGQSVLRLT